MTNTPHVPLMVDARALDHLTLALDALQERGAGFGGVAWKMAFDDEQAVLRALVADAKQRELNAPALQHSP